MLTFVLLLNLLLVNKCLSQTTTVTTVTTTTTPIPTIVTTTTTPIPTTTGQATSQGSFSAPPFSLTWTDNGNYTNFEHVTALSSADLVSLDNFYVAFGLANSNMMYNADVTVCSNSNEGLTVRRFHNPPSPSRTPVLLDKSIPSVGITNVSISNDKGKLTCSYSRLKTNKKYENYFDLSGNASYYIIMAKGPMSDGKLSYHNTRLASNSPINFLIPSNSSGDNGLDRGLAKSHGCFMVFAWIFCASTGIVFARYYKFIFPNTNWLGIQFWFHMHRPLMVCVPVLSIIALVLILFDQRWTWIDPINSSPISFAHSVTGIASISFSVFQVILGVIRPDKDSPNRFVFNWLHRWFGLLTFLCATTTIWLAIFMDRLANIGSVGWALMLGWTVWIFLLPFTIDSLAYLIGQGKSNPDEFSSFRRIRFFELIKTLLLPLHVVIALGVSIALIVMIGLIDIPN